MAPRPPGDDSPDPLASLLDSDELLRETAPPADHDDPSGSPPDGTDPSAPRSADADAAVTRLWGRRSTRRMFAPDTDLPADVGGPLIQPSPRDRDRYAPFDPALVAPDAETSPGSDDPDPLAVLGDDLGLPPEDSAFPPDPAAEPYADDEGVWRPAPAEAPPASAAAGDPVPASTSDAPAAADVAASPPELLPEPPPDEPPWSPPLPEAPSASPVGAHDPADEPPWSPPLPEAPSAPPVAAHDPAAAPSPVLPLAGDPRALLGPSRDRGPPSSPVAASPAPPPLPSSAPDDPVDVPPPAQPPDPSSSPPAAGDPAPAATPAPPPPAPPARPQPAAAADPVADLLAGSPEVLTPAAARDWDRWAQAVAPASPLASVLGVGCAILERLAYFDAALAASVGGDHGDVHDGDEITALFRDQLARLLARWWSTPEGASVLARPEASERLADLTQLAREGADSADATRRRAALVNGLARVFGLVPGGDADAAGSAVRASLAAAAWAALRPTHPFLGPLASALDRWEGVDWTAPLLLARLSLDPATPPLADRPSPALALLARAAPPLAREAFTARRRAGVWADPATASAESAPVEGALALWAPPHAVLDADRSVLRYTLSLGAPPAEARAFPVAALTDRVAAWKDSLGCDRLSLMVGLTHPPSGDGVEAVSDTVSCVPPRVPARALCRSAVAALSLSGLEDALWALWEEAP